MELLLVKKILEMQDAELLQILVQFSSENPEGYASLETLINEAF